MYDLCDLHKNSKCCLKSILLRCCDLKGWFCAPRSAPRAAYPRQVSRGPDKDTTELKFHRQCVPGPQGAQAPGVCNPSPASQRAGAARTLKRQLCCSLWKWFLKIVRAVPMRKLSSGRSPRRPRGHGRGPTGPSFNNFQSFSPGAFTFIFQNNSGHLSLAPISQWKIGTPRSWWTCTGPSC